MTNFNHKFFSGEKEFSAKKVGMFNLENRKLYGTENGVLFEIDRVIKYKAFGASEHECNAKCRNGSLRGTCECKCNGQNHGVSSKIVCS